MVIYEVELSIDEQSQQKYLTWLEESHIPNMLQIDGFLAADLEEVTDPVTEHLHLLVRYHVRSELDLFNYFELNAHLLKQEAIDLFGTQFSATRRITKRFKQFTNEQAIAHPHD